MQKLYVTFLLIYYEDSRCLDMIRKHKDRESVNIAVYVVYWIKAYSDKISLLNKNSEFYTEISLLK